MAEITAQLVKELRERTGAGMMECKSALKETAGDLGEAEVVLRKRGISSAHKKAARTTRQGLIAAYVQDDMRLGVLIEVNCESDFVARTEDFVALTNDLAEHIAESDPQFLKKEDAPAEHVHKALYHQPFHKDKSLSIEQLVQTKIAKMGENIAITRFMRFHVAPPQHGLVASYVHAGGQLGVLVLLHTGSEAGARNPEIDALAHDIAMQVAAADPQFLRKEEVTGASLEKERDIQRARALAEGKPEKVVDKIVEGRMAKYYEEVCLLEQPFVKENTLTMDQVIKNVASKTGETLTVARFARFKVGDTGQES